VENVSPLAQLLPTEIQIVAPANLAIQPALLALVAILVLVATKDLF